MATPIRPDLKDDIVKYGAACVDDCFNCGNCTAVCPLSQDSTAFPRKMVRYLQLGLKDKLSCASEPWLCYSCGECAATCPRDATPVNTMAALRRYTTAQYDVTGLAGLMYKMPIFALLLTLVLGFFLGLFHLSAQVAGHATEPAHWAAFSWIPYEAIHQIGIVVGGVMMLMIAAGVINAARLMLKPRGGFSWLLKHKPAAWFATLLETGRELASMKRHHECGSEDGGEPEPRPLTARFAHLTIMWGFIMLLGATTLDFLFVFLLKIEFYGIARPLGIIGGIVMLYGLLVFTWKRFKGATPSTKTTTFADAWLLFFLIVLDLTGFMLLAIVSLQMKGTFSDILILVHSVMAMELVLLFTLTKLGHAMFRPMALFFHLLDRRSQAT